MSLSDEPFLSAVKEIVLRQFDGDSGLSDTDTKHQFEICPTSTGRCCRTTPVHYITGEDARTKSLNLESDGLGCHDYCFHVSLLYSAIKWMVQ